MTSRGRCVVRCPTAIVACARSPTRLARISLPGMGIQCPAEASSVCFITTTALSMFALINSANSFGKKSLIQTNRVRFAFGKHLYRSASRYKTPSGFGVDKPAYVVIYVD